MTPQEVRAALWLAGVLPFGVSFLACTLIAAFAFDITEERRITCAYAAIVLGGLAVLCLLKAWLVLR